MQSNLHIEKIEELEIGDRIITVDNFDGTVAIIQPDDNAAVIEWDNPQWTPTLLSAQYIQTVLNRSSTVVRGGKPTAAAFRWNTTCPVCGSPAYDDQCFAWECSRGCERV